MKGRLTSCERISVLLINDHTINTTFWPTFRARSSRNQINSEFARFQCGMWVKDHDYAKPGAYFVTICTYERECSLGEIVNGQMRLSEDGDIVRAQWVGLSLFHSYVELDVFVIMPNHLHGLIKLTENGRAEIQGGLVSPPYSHNNQSK